MKFSDDSQSAANYLRQAVPTMVKHGIVPNPLNYTLWYSYYSNEYPKLNEELDHAINYYGTCPPRVGEALFLQHFNQVDDKNAEQLESMQQAFSQVVTSLSHSLSDSNEQSKGFAEALKGNISNLDTFSLDEEMRSVVKDLSANANAICDNNESVSCKLNSAQLEINALKRELAATREEANTDPLTRLSNRRVFESIYHEFVSSCSEDENLTLIMMDIDKFKAFNDTHGHLVGDQILTYVGKMLKNECPESITPVRFGGEEFAILCPGIDQAKASEFAEKIRRKLASTPLKNSHSGEKIAPITASFGIARKQADDVLSTIIERADIALYEAKNAGRNQVKVA
ncbi:GGDEF domain-containing protein [Glaciecola sp. 2405UD65-10]|uniref:GGDEF domain-containing protein n=1 Tax=Glaciecola sp. 2405UD65-10 TaxID=3397244 RepID=UPI003B5CFDF5